MSLVARMAGAIIARTGDHYFLVGALKRPCNFPAFGFAAPAEAAGAPGRPFVQLQPAGPVRLTGPWLAFDLEGEPLARMLGERLLIERNGSVSDRLWRLLLSPDPDAPEPSEELVLPAQWLAAMPAHLWHIVREAVLKCV